MTLKDFFEKYNKAVLGFSGGVDSSFLLYAGKKYGADIKGIFVKGQFQPEFELEDARKVAQYIGTGFTVLETDVLQDANVVANSKDRCYYCKNHIFGEIAKFAKAEGYEYILDGTNASDDLEDRAGTRALREMKVLSPLRMCGLTKLQVRELSKEAGLFTWEKPSYACLATRIPAYEIITEEKLNKIQRSEGTLNEMGFRDFRIRLYGNAARIQVIESQMKGIIEKRKEIQKALNSDFDAIMLDLVER